MTKGVKVLIIAISFIFIVSVIAGIFSLRKTDKTYVEIVQNNKVLYTFDLSIEEDRFFRIETSDGGWNEVKINNGQISITDADCPDKTCVKTGVLRSESIPIVCLPHKLVIRYADKEDE